MKPIRVYADTSVFGGMFDKEFEEWGKPFFDRVRDGEIELVVSSAVSDELSDAPDIVLNFFEELKSHLIRVEIGEEVYNLQQAYLEANVVGRKWEVDALHVAAATVFDCPIIVSWNFKHIVNFRRIPLYNAVNFAQGYGPIAIHTPPEVQFDDDTED